VHDHSSVAAELEGYGLLRVCRLELPAHLGGPGEGDLLEPFVPSELSGPTPSDGKHGAHSGRQIRLGEELPQEQRSERRLGGGLDDDRRADREGRRHLVRHQVDREVERRDRQHGSEGEAPDQCGPGPEALLGVEAHDLALETAALLRGPPEGGNGASGLDLCPLEGLAPLARDDLCDLLDALIEAPGDVHERLGARVSRQLASLLEAVRRGLHRPFDVSLLRQGNGRDEGAVVRVRDLDRLAALLPLACDEVFLDLCHQSLLDVDVRHHVLDARVVLEPVHG
jgi:hypothetical protein